MKIFDPVDKYKLQPNSMQVGFIMNLKKILETGEDRALLISVTGAHVILMTGRKALIYKEFGPVFSIFFKYMGENMMRGENIAN